MTLAGVDATRLAETLVARCRQLAMVTDVPGETTRTFLSDGMRRANACVALWMQEAGMATRVDAAGNLRGVLPGRDANAGRFLIASHLDTVPDAGAFDGPLGVLAGIALAGQIGPGVLPYALEVIGFSEEEGVRFGVPFLGSRALVGTLDEATLNLCDAGGVSVREAMRAFGLPDELGSATVQDAIGFLEFHIEQGPELDVEGLPLAVVETVVGLSRLLLTLHGKANHAGTTPMRLRRDALAAAAAFIVQVEAHARGTPGLVATVGSMHALPNAANVIAGEVRLSLDVRSAKDATRDAAVRSLLSAAQAIAAERGLQLAVETRLVQPAVPLDPALRRVLEDSVDENGGIVRRMTSGAGHDAMILASHLPASMLFVRSPEGVSHHPSETVRTDDVALALRVGYSFLHRLPAAASTSRPVATPAERGGTA